MFFKENLSKISPNVLVFTNPRALKGRSDWVRQGLGSQWLSPESASLLLNSPRHDSASSTSEATEEPTGSDA